MEENRAELPGTSIPTQTSPQDVPTPAPTKVVNTAPTKVVTTAPEQQDGDSCSSLSSMDEGTTDPFWQRYVRYITHSITENVFVIHKLILLRLFSKREPPQVTSSVRVKMQSAGLYERFPPEATLIADFKKYLRDSLKVSNNQQEVRYLTHHPVNLHNVVSICVLSLNNVNAKGSG